MVFPSIDDPKSNGFMYRKLGLTLMEADTNTTAVEDLAMHHAFFNDIILDMPQHPDLPKVKRHLRLRSNGVPTTLLTLKNSDPLLLSEAVGKGQVFVMATALSPKWSDFADNALFVPTMVKAAFMGGKMGKRIVAMRYIDNVVDAYISTLVLHPERLSDTVIVESVERELVNRLCWIDFDNVEELHQERPGRTPSTLRGWWRKNRMKPVEYYQRKVGINVPVLKATLKEPVFSCRPDKLFYYADDTIQHSDWEIQTASANLQRLDSLSRAYGKTLFLVAIPDKYTAYHHLIDGADNSPRLLEDCPFDTLPCFINTLPAIRAEIEKGVADVYLPDDTHFSIPTAKATGEYVANQIISRP